jgi:hypothetical protein
MIGFGINYMANLVVLPMLGIYVSLRENFHLGLLCTIISAVRRYTVRGRFNKHITSASTRLAGSAG